MAPTVRQLLRVNRSAGDDRSHPGAGETWTRDVEMDFLPIMGDMIMLWPGLDPDDPFGGVEWPVLNRCFSVAGTVGIELVHMYVDPEEQSLREIRALKSTTGRAWWTDDGVDPQDKLPSGGWVRR